MGRVILKEAPDTDYYVVWSSVADAPAFGGTREELLAELRRDSRYVWRVGAGRECDEFIRQHAVIEENEIQERVRRTDEFGTSSLDRWDGDWNDAGFIYEQRGWCPRSNVFVLTRRLREGVNPHVCDLLEPFEDRPDAGVRCPGCDDRRD